MRTPTTKKSILKKEMSIPYCDATRYDFLDDDELPLILKAMEAYAKVKVQQYKKSINKVTNA